MATNTTVSAPAGASFGAEGMPRHHIAIFAGLLVLLLIAPFVLSPIFVMKVLCFALFACAFNLLFGYGGMLSFGHAALFGMASYVTAQAARDWGFNPEFAVLAGVLPGRPARLVARRVSRGYISCFLPAFSFGSSSRHLSSTRSAA